MCDRTPLEEKRERDNHARIEHITKQLAQIIDLLTALVVRGQERTDEKEADHG
jgi:hypothetical protein